jgi:hypothetical protein
MHTVSLSERDVEGLHGAWNLESWRKFVREAPPEWKTSGILMTHLPIFIQLSYGQDMELDVSENSSVTEEYFANACRWEELRYVSFALATHVR